MNKGISIITNFGCPNDCWYCIMKDHHLKGVQSKWDYSKLDDFLYENRDKGKVSISGGGDPLNNYFENLIFWSFIIKKCKFYNIKIDIHTRIALPKARFWSEHVNLVAFSVDKLTKQIKKDLLYLNQLTKVRVYHVINAKDKESDLVDLYNFCSENNLTCTFKQLHGFEDNGLYAKLKEEWPWLLGLHFTDDEDYNIYYMPDNTITDKFIK